MGSIRNLHYRGLNQEITRTDSNEELSSAIEMVRLSCRIRMTKIKLERQIGRITEEESDQLIKKICQSKRKSLRMDFDNAADVWRFLRFANRELEMAKKFADQVIINC